VAAGAEVAAGEALDGLAAGLAVLAAGLDGLAAGLAVLAAGLVVLAAGFAGDWAVVFAGEALSTGLGMPGAVSGGVSPYT
jgi:hypothetical protein